MLIFKPLTRSAARNLYSSLSSQFNALLISPLIKFRRGFILPIISNNWSFQFSKQKIIEQLEQFSQQLQEKKFLSKPNTQEKKNLFQQKQQKIIKDFLELTEESFNEHLQAELKQKHQIDWQMLLMIVSSLQNPKVIKQNLVKLYPFVGIFSKQELLLFLQLLLAYTPKKLPPIQEIQPRSLNEIDSVLLLLSELYPKKEYLVEWLKQLPLYQGKNLVMITAGFFSIFQKMTQEVKFKNQKIIKRCIERIVHLAADQDEQIQASIAILAFQSIQTCHFGQKLLIELQKINFKLLDSTKLQLLFIHLQRHLANKYISTKKKLKSKNTYKILEETELGEITERVQEEYALSAREKLEGYDKTSEIQRYQYLSNISSQLCILIMDLDWKETLKISFLLDYWKLFTSFQSISYPFNSFQNKIINFTAEQKVVSSLMKCPIEQIFTILQIMDELKINKSQLLLKCLALVSNKIQLLESQQLIKLAKICVTFVRQCEDFLISLRLQIERRKFIFKDDQIDQLNVIFKKVLVLFPRPLIK